MQIDIMVQAHYRSLIFLLLLFLAPGWTTSGFSSEEHRDNPVLLSGEVYRPAKNYSGDSWYTPGWLIGSVETFNGEAYSGLQLRYNSFLDELFWITPGSNSHVMLDKNTIKGFSLVFRNGDTELFRQVFISDPVTGVPQGHYARVLFDDNGVTLYGLFHQRLSSRSETIHAGAGSAHLRILTNSTSWFLSTPDGKLRPVRTRNRAFLNSFGSDRDAVRQVLRANNLRVRDQATLIHAARLISRMEWQKDIN